MFTRTVSNSLLHTFIIAADDTTKIERHECVVNIVSYVWWQLTRQQVTKLPPYVFVCLSLSHDLDPSLPSFNTTIVFFLILSVEWMVHGSLGGWVGRQGSKSQKGLKNINSMSSSGHHLGQTVANLLHLYYTYLGTIAVLSRDRMTIVEGMKNVASHVFYGSSLLTFPAGLLLLLLFWL